MSKNKKIQEVRVGLDIDGTIRNIYDSLLNELKNRNPDVDFPPVNQWTDYRIWKKLNLKEDKFKTMWWHSTLTPKFYNTEATFYERGFFIELAGKDKEERPKIILISGLPNSQTLFHTMSWLQRYQFPFDEFHMTKEKHLVLCDYYIEDSPAYMKQLIGDHGVRAVKVNESIKNNKPEIIKINRPWNKTSLHHHAAFDTVEEAFRYIHETERGLNRTKNSITK